MYRYFKRPLDFILTFILALLFLPVWVIVPLVIWLDSGWPVIYSHRRAGQNGREFRLYKFRTMIKNADEILYKKNKRLLEKFKAGDWKLESDPRITKLGRFLRNLTIDEFPQLLNVVRGEMSLVGPRPIVQEEIRYYGNDFELYISVLPGLSGLWQVSGRRNVQYPERVWLDAYYVRNRSIWLDLLILFKTFWVVLKRDGAY